MNLYESLKKNLKEDEELTIVKEPGDGAIVKDASGKEYYQAGSTSQGYCFKDLDAYENDRDAVCYICEFAFNDLENENQVIPVEDLTGDKLAKAIKDGGVSTHNSIIEELKHYWNYIEVPIKEEFLEQAAEFIFETVDWQSTGALIDEVNWDGYTEDTKGEDFEQQIEKGDK